jgi:hypothetical protein
VPSITGLGKRVKRAAGRNESHYPNPAAEVMHSRVVVQLDVVAAVPRLRGRQMVRQLTDKAASTSNCAATHDRGVNAALARP